MIQAGIATVRITLGYILKCLNMMPALYHDLNKSLSQIQREGGRKITISSNLYTRVCLDHDDLNNNKFITALCHNVGPIPSGETRHTMFTLPAELEGEEVTMSLNIDGKIIEKKIIVGKDMNMSIILNEDDIQVEVVNGEKPKKGK